MVTPFRSGAHLPIGLLVSRCLLLIASLLGAAKGMHAQDVTPPPDIASLDIEELGRIKVTSVARRPELFAEAAAAVSVITREDIRRSGATTLPEALRLVPGLQSARLARATGRSACAGSTTRRRTSCSC